MAVAEDDAESAVGSVNVTVVVDVQPLRSVTVYVYVPATSENEPVPV